MKYLDENTIAALQNAPRDGLVLRHLIWIQARNRTMGESEEAGFWNDVTDATIEVISGRTRLPISRNFTAAGSLIAISEIQNIADLSIRQARITLSQVSPEVAQAIRGYDPRLAPIEIYSAMMNPDTMAMVAAPQPVFVGHVGKVPIKTPPVGQEGSITITAFSATRLLTRGNPDKRTHESQQRRDGCGFYRYANIAGQVEVRWGGTDGKVGREPERPVSPNPVKKTS